MDLFGGGLVGPQFAALRTQLWPLLNGIVNHESYTPEVAQQFPKSDSAPEALYWAGVSKYKASHDPAPLGETARALKERYPESSWTKKASVWAA